MQVDAESGPASLPSLASSPLNDLTGQPRLPGAHCVGLLSICHAAGGGSIVWSGFSPLLGLITCRTPRRQHRLEAAHCVSLLSSCRAFDLQVEAASGPASLPSLASSHADEDEDEEMMDADDDEEADEEAGEGEAVPPAMAAAAEAVGIDLAFLQALPPELRGEVRDAQVLWRWSGII